jgi:hypothetical protein
LVERVGENRVARKRGDDRNEIEMTIDSFASMAVVRFRSGREERAS